MKYRYHVRLGSSYDKRFSKIVYRTNSKAAAYRYGWSLVKKSGCCPNIFEDGKFLSTLLVHESQVKVA